MDKDLNEVADERAATLKAPGRVHQPQGRAREQASGGAGVCQMCLRSNQEVSVG